MNTYTGTGVPLATERAAAATVLGAATTFAAKMGTGKPLGDIWSIYKGLTNLVPNGFSLHYWHSEIVAGRKTRADLAFGLGVSSPPSTPTFVAGIYARAMGRAPSIAETDYWVNLINGGMARHVAAVNICISAEAVTYRLAQQPGFWLS